MLDEASGLRKNVDQPVVVGGVKQGTAEVASWNVKRVSSGKTLGAIKEWVWFSRMPCGNRSASSSSSIPEMCHAPSLPSRTKWITAITPLCLD